MEGQIRRPGLDDWEESMDALRQLAPFVNGWIENFRPELVAALGAERMLELEAPYRECLRVRMAGPVPDLDEGISSESSDDESEADELSDVEGSKPGVVIAERR
jgi:hypothetical protein